MSRDIKFRVWQDGKMLATPIGSNFGLKRFFGFIDENAILMQFTGLKDKKGLDIYEGDILKYRNPEIGYQTHTGDNIPNGSYTEPTGAIISEKEYEVIFHCGSFQLLDTSSRYIMPMQYLFDEQTEALIELDHDTILKQIDLKRNRDIFDNDYSDAQEELECLLEELEMTLSTLIEHCKLEIIGNIHDENDKIK